MTIRFKTLLSKKGLTKEMVTNFPVNNVQVAALQAMMVSQPLSLQKWACLYGHRLMEGRCDADEIACQIRKLNDNDVRRNYPSTDGTSKFEVQFRKGTEEEFPDESAFITDAVGAVKRIYER